MRLVREGFRVIFIRIWSVINCLPYPGHTLSLHILHSLQSVSMDVFSLTHFLFTPVASFPSACWRKRHAVNSAGQM